MRAEGPFDAMISLHTLSSSTCQIAYPKTEGYTLEVCHFSKAVSSEILCSLSQVKNGTNAYLCQRALAVRELTRVARILMTLQAS